MDKKPDKKTVIPPPEDSTGIPKEYTFVDFQKENPPEQPAPGHQAVSPVPAPEESTAKAAKVSTIDPRHTGNPDTAPVSPGPSNRFRGLFHRHPGLFLTASLTMTFLFLGGLIGAVILYDYSTKAEKYDLSRVTELEAGSIARDANGNILGQVALKDRRQVSLDEVPQHLVDALIATEDSRFFEHNGIDIVGISRAAVANVKAGHIAQGGSTITQQLARHAFDLTGRTFNRKFLEMFLARRIEEEYSKDEILQSYLNRIYLGSGFWGVESAARGYFGKRTRDLNLSEAATLCAIIKSPNRFSPYKDLEEATAARNRTLERMKHLGLVTEAGARNAIDSKLEVLSQEKRGDRPHYLLAAIRKETLDILGQYHRLDELDITTTVNFTLQEKAIGILTEQLERIENSGSFPYPSKKELEQTEPASTDYLQGALVVIENNTGNIVAAVGGRDYTESQFNRVWQGRRKPGTAITPFLYAAAFDGGIARPRDLLVDAPLDNRKIMIGGTSGVLGEWGTENPGNDYEGEITAAYALAAGKNGATVRLGQQVGLDRFHKVLEQAGIHGDLTGYPNSYLGESPVNILDLVHAYTNFPTLGQAPTKLSLIQKITDKSGKVLYQSVPEPAPAVNLSAATASDINLILKKTFDIDPLRPRSNGLGQTLAGKTGTSYNSEDNWFIGYNASYTWGIWIGFDKPKPIYEHAFSKDTSFPVWKALAANLATSAPLPAENPESRTLHCLVTGEPAGKFCGNTEHGDLTVSLPETEEAGHSPEVCQLHSGDSRPAGNNSTRKPEPEPDLFTGFTPVRPKVELVIGGNPWASPPPSSPTPRTP